MSDHYSVEFEQNDEGWWLGRCHCGADLGFFPDAEDACDALMDHAYEAGAADAAERARAGEWEARPSE
jgi:hypothetical protein